MARPYKGYEIDGEKVPGVTTVLSRFKESGALMYWAWKQGTEGKDFRETKQAAADAVQLRYLAELLRDGRVVLLQEEGT